MMPTHNKPFLFVCAEEMPCEVQHITKAVTGGVSRLCYLILLQVYDGVLLVPLLTMDAVV